MGTGYFSHRFVSTAGRHAIANSDRRLAPPNAAGVIKEGGLGDPQLRASNEGLLRPRVARAQGITQAARSAVQANKKSLLAFDQQALNNPAASYFPTASQQQ